MPGSGLAITLLTQMLHVRDFKGTSEGVMVGDNIQYCCCIGQIWKLCLMQTLEPREAPSYATGGEVFMRGKNYDAPSHVTVIPNMQNNVHTPQVSQSCRTHVVQWVERKCAAWN